MQGAVIRIGFGGIVYCNYSRNPPKTKKNSIGNHLSPILTLSPKDLKRSPIMTAAEIQRGRKTTNVSSRVGLPGVTNRALRVCCLDFLTPLSSSEFRV